VRLAARLSTATATAFPQSVALLPGARVTGYPVRDEFLHVDRATARRRLGFGPDENVVVAFGGSLGARSINTAVAGALEQLLPVAHVIHVTGREALSNGLKADKLTADGFIGRYHPYQYLDAAAMADALVAADLAICRAGASTMAELPVVGTPAILIPGEFSAQEGNARALADHGAATVIRDRELTSALLARETLALLQDKRRLAVMAAACRALAHRDAAAQVAAIICEISGQRAEGGRQ
jgi:UDP-N-acetylglucosamine--N-acetylmuramyl-(pentapeptide) pyrophosphoryl-undecaprenol N-acetylglucosamine transferase